MSIGGPANPLIAELLNNPRAFTKRPGGSSGFPPGIQETNSFDDEVRRKKMSKIDERDGAMKNPTEGG